ncbi:MAG: SPFH domain-containing protein [bacterium]|nr:hypothetical protein [bacterium]
MRKNIKKYVIALCVFIALFVLVLSEAFYVVNEAEYAVKVRSNKIIGNPISQPGLYFKVPLVEKVKNIEKRMFVHNIEPDSGTVVTKDKKLIRVGTSCVLKIIDPKLFLDTAGSMRSLLTRVDDIVLAGLREVLSQEPLDEILRVSNDLVEKNKHKKTSYMASVYNIKPSEISKGRDKIAKKIKENVRIYLKNYGVALIDIIFTKVSFDEAYAKQVYQMMIEELELQNKEVWDKGIKQKEAILKGE